MKLKQLIAAASIALAGVSSSYAAGGALGGLNSAGSTASNSFLANLNSSWYEPTFPATSLAFSDVYTFSVNSAANFFVTGGFNATVTGGGLTLSGTGILGTQAFSWGDAPIVLTNGGSYTLTIAGLAGQYGGGYQGVLRNSVAAVPEPESYAMLLAGLGAVIVIARRRNKAESA